MTVLLTGAKGMLAADVLRLMPAETTIIETDIEELDITDVDAVMAFCKECAPNMILNCAAYTAVDAAETNDAAAYAVNETGPRVLAEVCAHCDIPLVHISTDFVFFGDGKRPMREDDQTAPQGIYALSKRAGEVAIEKSGCSFLTVRTSWLYGAAGNNFPDTMLKLAAERDRVTVVNDQTGSPTYSPDLAEALWKLIEAGARGYIHFSNSGACTWYDFAVETIQLGKEYGILPADKTLEIAPVTSEEFVRPAPRPAYSVMGTEKYTKTTGLTPRTWQAGLREYIAAKKS
jgi:dTDP-4-dehydrorhamnose reductase